MVTAVTSSKALILQPIIRALEQLTIESTSINEPKINGQIGPNVQSVTCQMALINICTISVEATTIDNIIAEEAYSATSFLHDIGTRVLIRCMEHTPLNVILQNAKAIGEDPVDMPSFITEASRVLSIAKDHMVKEVSHTHWIFRIVGYQNYFICFKLHVSDLIFF